MLCDTTILQVRRQTSNQNCIWKETHPLVLTPRRIPMTPALRQLMQTKKWHCKLWRGPPRHHKAAIFGKLSRIHSKDAGLNRRQKWLMPKMLVAYVGHPLTAL
jgi:hypothetical protein